MLATRQAVSSALAARYSHAFLTALQGTKAWRGARAIGIYLPVRGEASPLAVVDLARRSGREIYLPVIDVPERGTMRFGPWQSQTEFAPNRFGINEPVLVSADLCSPMSLDLVLAPLLAFDRLGNRLGMGGGYYDRAFAGRSGKNPRLIGIAYDCQRVEALPVEPWDVPLDAVITESGLQVF